MKRRPGRTGARGRSNSPIQRRKRYYRVSTSAPPANVCWSYIVRPCGGPLYDRVSLGVRVFMTVRGRTGENRNGLKRGERAQSRSRSHPRPPAGSGGSGGSADVGVGILPARGQTYEYVSCEGAGRTRFAEPLLRFVLAEASHFSSFLVLTRARMVKIEVCSAL